MVDTTKLCALLDTASPRPWRANVWYGSDDGGWAAIGPHCVASEADGYDDAPGSSSYDQAMADAALIAAAVNTLPELLDEVERLRARIDAICAGYAAARAAARSAQVARLVELIEENEK